MSPPEEADWKTGHLARAYEVLDHLERILKGEASWDRVEAAAALLQGSEGPDAAAPPPDRGEAGADDAGAPAPPAPLEQLRPAPALDEGEAEAGAVPPAPPPRAERRAADAGAGVGLAPPPHAGVPAAEPRGGDAGAEPVSPPALAVPPGASSTGSPVPQPEAPPAPVRAGTPAPAPGNGSPVAEAVEDGRGSRPETEPPVAGSAVDMTLPAEGPIDLSLDPLPFRGSRASPPASGATDPRDDPLGQTAAPNLRNLPQVLPFETPSGDDDIETLRDASPSEQVLSLPEHLRSFTIEHYASLCAECAVHPDRVQDVERRYRVRDPQERAALDRVFRARMNADPALAERYRWLVAQYRDWAERQPR